MRVTKTKHNDQPEIRRASHKDIDRLIAICRDGFPGSVFWNGPMKPATNWWVRMIHSPNVETYLIIVDQQIAGFYVLIIDLTNYRAEIGQDRQAERSLRLQYLLSALIRPRLARAVLLKTVRAVKLFFRRWEVRNRNAHLYLLLPPVDVPIDKLAWCEIQAIAGSCRGKGLARLLSRYADRRCKELGKVAIGGRVERDNHAVMALLKAAGSTPLTETKGGFTYRRMVRTNGRIEDLNDGFIA